MERRGGGGGRRKTTGSANCELCSVGWQDRDEWKEVAVVVLTR